MKTRLAWSWILALGLAEGLVIGGGELIGAYRSPAAVLAAVLAVGVALALVVYVRGLTAPFAHVAAACALGGVATACLMVAFAPALAQNNPSFAAEVRRMGGDVWRAALTDALLTLVYIAVLGLVFGGLAAGLQHLRPRRRPRSR